MIPNTPPESMTQPEPGLVYRCYRLPDGQAVETYELPATVVRALGMPRLLAAIDASIRGQRRRAESVALLVAITERLGHGIKPLAIADELGCSDAYVRMVRSRLESGHGTKRRDQDSKQRAAGRGPEA